jgi:RNA polymerase sigma-70 factor, ECF subfamily
MIPSLLADIRSGHPGAFTELYEISLDRVYRFVYHRILDTVATEDIVSDTFMKAWRSISKFRGETEAEYYAWIQRIAYTTLIDYTRAPLDESLDPDLDPGSSIDHAGDIDNRDKLAQVLEFMQ